MAHQAPNTANIPNDLDTAGKKKLYGKELRALWCAPKNRLLVGCDAEGIQLRIFAHYINDPEFTDALVKGRKDDKTDPHSLNQSILGGVCKSRAAAKRFIYALLLGAGLDKLTEILGCTTPETQEALDRLLVRYAGWQLLRSEVFPKDAKRGWFEGLDGRAVRIPGDTDGGRRHLAMSGYLQNGEAVCMKLATLKWHPKLKEYDAKLVNFVHDEWQVECPNDMKVALLIADLMAQSLKDVGSDLNLKCPLAGSYWNDDHKDYTIDTNWSKTH
jgi:DNA polymerase-1